MIYQLKDSASKMTLKPLAKALQKSHELVNHDANPLRNTIIGRFQSASLESGYRLLKGYSKPEYSLDKTIIDGKEVTVTKETIVDAPFGDLIRFKRDGSDQAPKVLFVAAMSGHYATLGQATYKEFLPDYDVYVTDWKNARDVPLSEGKFGFEEYVAYLIEFLEKMGPNTHVVGICQAAVPALVAAGVMAQEKNPSRPKSLTLMAGPIDIRVNPQKMIDTLSKYVSLDTFKLALQTVPKGYKGAGRKVYPGATQIGAFLSMNVKDHVKKHIQFFVDVFKDKGPEAEKHRQFYDEYMATLDGAGEFFIETLERVFFEFHLPEGKMMYKGKLVDCTKITDIALFTIEGEDDDMCLIGNTEAAHTICSNLPDELRQRHLQSGVGHYGVFNGSKYRSEIAPRIKEFMQKHTAPVTSASSEAAKASTASSKAKDSSTSGSKKAAQ
ncbi:MAG: polyhydroxyalkanoate depolymerase [Amphritea sp.]